VTADSFRDLVINGQIVEDKKWFISQNWERIKAGDELFIYTGDKNLGIIGYAMIAGVRKRDGRWSLQPRFDLKRCQALLNHPIPATIVRQWVFPRRAVVNLEPSIDQLRTCLPWTKPMLAEEVAVPEGLAEGAHHRIWVNAFERNPEARRQCIAAHQPCCSICKYDFEANFGPDFAGFIHVHHLLPLSQIRDEYIVDPVADLVPICPNCHAAIHCGGQHRTIEEVKRLLRQHKQA
jgi:hypothetical protein